MLTRLLLAAGAAAAASTAIAEPSSTSAMRWHRRILLVSAPDPRSNQAALQRRIVSDWHRQAAERDLTLVEVAESVVTGASDPAATLRKRFHLRAGRFEALLIGKDGHVALRSARPIDAATLQRTIDAMPMRRAGER